MSLWHVSFCSRRGVPWRLWTVSRWFHVFRRQFAAVTMSRGHVLPTWVVKLLRLRLRHVLSSDGKECPGRLSCAFSRHRRKCDRWRYCYLPCACPCLQMLTLCTEQTGSPIECPASHYCDVGTVVPLLCPLGTYCPPGSSFPLVCRSVQCV